MLGRNEDPHGALAALTEGVDGIAALVLIHGRGASAAGILEFGRTFRMQELALVAPQAAGNTWYPNSFLAPLEQNQPYLDSALRRIDSLMQELLASGLPSHRIALLGFSQGACLALECVARHPRRYGAVMGLTGGLIGPPGTPRDYHGTLDGTPVFLGSGDPDPHVPFHRVNESAAVLTKLGAKVDLHRYPGLPHMINEEEHAACRALLRTMIDWSPV